ncbi:UNVERIFIED_CONTAM: Nuclear envelope-associated protein 2 [Sesamum latifolium]|uniref:Nuclear envelope-associated protein 2 n=1 Tax=Sesamum latifolium TaxID=2727402 RepID=A0AAW2XLA9_9LAMI
MKSRSCLPIGSLNERAGISEKHHRADQELKKKVLKLEFCLQEARSQTRKLQRMGERRDKALKELRDQLAAKQPSPPPISEKHNFWETSGFKIVVSMSMLILVMFEEVYFISIKTAKAP